MHTYACACMYDLHVCIFTYSHTRRIQNPWIIMRTLLYLAISSQQVALPRLSATACHTPGARPVHARMRALASPPRACATLRQRPTLPDPEHRQPCAASPPPQCSPAADNNQHRLPTRASTQIKGGLAKDDFLSGFFSTLIYLLLILHGQGQAIDKACPAQCPRPADGAQGWAGWWPTPPPGLAEVAIFGF